MTSIGSSILKEDSARADENGLACVCGGDSLIDLGPCREPGVSGCSEYERELCNRIDPGSLYRCQTCHLGLRLPSPDLKTIAQLYESLPPTRWKPGVVAGSAQQEVVRRFTQSVNRRLAILDIGAFDGSYLKAFPDSFLKAAIEPSQAANQLTSDGIQVLKPFLGPAVAAEIEGYDVVTMFDVFEHLPNPIEGMRAAMSYVRTGGSLFVGTGNMDHWSWKQNRGNHWYLDPIQHVAFGSPRHFRWLFDRLPCTSMKLRKLSHQPGTLRERILQGEIAAYFGIRQRAHLQRSVVKLMHRFARYRRFSEKTAMPYTQQLNDHLLIEFVR